MTSKRNASRRVAFNISQVLLAAAIASSVALTGCKRSESGSAANDAVDAADHASRLTVSAGELRLKPEYAEQLKGKDAAEIKQSADSASSAIKGDTLNQHGVWKQYLEQKSVSADLDAAADILKKATSPSEFSDPALKSSVQAQLGATQLANARLHLAAAQDKLLQLTGLAGDLQAAAVYVNELGAQAGAQESLAKGDQPADLSKLKSAVDDRKAASDKAQQGVSDLEKQIADKQAEAAKIYSDTDAAFAAAEGMKGTAAIDAAKKAAEDRKAADKLSEEAADLQPTLANARTDLAVAKIQQADAESQLMSATTGNTQSDVRVKDANLQATGLHDQAKKLLGGDAGLDAKYKAFMELANSIKDDISKAETAASGAAASYAAAISSASAFTSSLSALSLPDGDPLTSSKFKENDARLKAMLQLATAASKEELARTHLIGYTVGILKASAATAMKQAYAAAGTPKDTAADAADKDAEESKTSALSEFDAAATTAESVAGGAKDGSPEKWLGYTLDAVARHGKYLIDHQPTDKQAYEAAAQNAASQNPFLELGGLTPIATNGR